MRHNIYLEGFNLRVRPVRLEDAAFIVWLRNLDYVKGNVGDSATDVTAQEAWLQRYFERDDDYYFIVESLSGIPLGTHGIYNVNGTSAERGRHIMRPETMAGVPSAVLSADWAFGKMGLRELQSWVVATNSEVLSLHRKSGFKEIGRIAAAQVIDGKPADKVEFLFTAVEWKKRRDRVLPLAHFAGKQVLEWEQTQLGKEQPWEKNRK
ncbi:MAG TPA: GNAT family protein [Candidatus Saccharimonadales bacterium]|nr:GNAT family protein [Candidatus Saccharimonadales bacterium]